MYKLISYVRHEYPDGSSNELEVRAMAAPNELKRGVPGCAVIKTAGTISNGIIVNNFGQAEELNKAIVEALIEAGHDTSEAS